MAIRKDEVQLDLTIVTDEARQMARTIEDSRDLAKELRKAQKAGGDTSEVIKKIAAAGKQAEKIDLSKLTTSQMVTRARQLSQQMKLIPQSAPLYGKLQTELKRTNDQLATTRAQSRGVAKGMDGAKKSFGNFATAMKGTVVLALAAGLAKLVDFGKEMFALGPTLDQMDGKAERVFGNMQEYVEEFAASNAESLGLSKREYKDLTAATQDVLIPLEFERDLAAEIAVTTTNASGKLAEWTSGKVNSKQASEILTKAYLGERDGLTALGIKIDEAQIKERLRLNGLDKLTGASLKQAKVLATQQLVMEQTSDAQAEFADNSDSAARAQARTTAKMAELREEIATKAGPIIDKLSVFVFKLAGQFLKLVGPVSNFASRLIAVAEGSKTFQRVAGVAVGLVVAQFKNLGTAIGGISEGLLQLFEGDFSGAFETAKTAFAEIGKTTANSVKDGYNSGISNFKFFDDDEEVEVPVVFKEGGVDFDKAFADLKNDPIEVEGKAKKKGKEKTPAEIAKDELDAAIKEVRAGTERVDLVERIAYARREKTAEAAVKARFDNQVEGLELELEVLRDRGQAESDAYLETQAKLAELRRNEADKRAEEEAAAKAKRQEKDAAGLQEEFELRDAGLRQAFANQIITEQELQEERFRLKEEQLQRELKLLQEHGKAETAEARSISSALIDISVEKANKEIENAERSERLKKQLNENGYNDAKEALTQGLELLGEETEARKAVAGALKAFETAKVGVDLAGEIQSIWKTANANPANALFPGAGAVIAGVKTALATGRAGVAVKKIQSTKYARGGKYGFFDGPSHAGNGVKGYFSDGTEVEVEGDEFWAVVNKRDSASLKYLSDTNSRHGKRFFSGGGMLGSTAPRTTPVDSTQAASARVASDPALLAEMRATRKAIEAFPRELHASVSYKQIRSADDKARAIEQDAVG